jgi:excisionase family DNA binding protein
MRPLEQAGKEQLDSEVPVWHKGRPKVRSTSVFEKQVTNVRPLWNVNEVALFLGLSVRTIRDLVYKRSIPFRKAGRSLRFKPEDIERWTLP